MTMLALASLVLAILFEVSATLCLRMAAGGSRLWWLAIGLGYVLAFSMLSLTLAEGTPLGVAYGVWAAAGVALTAILSRVLFKEPLTRVMSLGIALIIGGERDGDQLQPVTWAKIRKPIEISTQTPSSGA